MAFNKDQKVSWEDLKQLYINLNTARAKFSFSSNLAPADQTNNPTHAQELGTINSLINEMKSNKYLTSVALTNVAVPTVASLLQVKPVNDLSTNISTIQNTCAFDASFFAANNGFNSSYNGSGFDSSFNSSGFFGSCNSFDSSFNSSCNSFDSGFHGSGFNGGGHNSPHNSGFFSASTCSSNRNFDSSK